VCLKYSNFKSAHNHQNHFFLQQRTNFFILNVFRLLYGVAVDIKKNIKLFYLSKYYAQNNIYY